MMKHVTNLVNYGKGILRSRFRPGWSRQLMQVGESILCVFGKGLGPIVHQGEPVIGSVHAVNTALLYNKVTEALFSLLKVSLLSRLNVFKVDFDKGVPKKNCLSNCMQIIKYSKE